MKRYTKNIENYIKTNKIPIPMKRKLKGIETEQERNFYPNHIYADLCINISKHNGNDSIYLN